MSSVPGSARVVKGAIVGIDLFIILQSRYRNQIQRASLERRGAVSKVVADGGWRIVAPRAVYDRRTWAAEENMRLVTSPQMTARFVSSFVADSRL